ncbi:hypothetical protein HK102_012042 [Quaeritorhiza haematococci]|nr:hypothetical protein HK102_012042 [Quaeritorhiza haematococci]
MTFINLTKDNAIGFLVQYVEAAQQKGAFTLREASLLKKATDYYRPEVTDKSKLFADRPEENQESIARSLLLQAVQVGQAKGAYTLADASTLHEIVTFVEKTFTESKNRETNNREAQQDANPEDVVENKGI